MSTAKKPMKIGELLVSSGVLTSEQVEEILQAQKESSRPFGDLAEKMFGVDPRAVERAWVDQYLSYDTLTDLSLESVEEDALQMVSRRQAWQFKILPIRFEGGQLLAVTSQKNLRRAVNFAWSVLSTPVCFMIAEESQLRRHLEAAYPWASLPAEMTA